MLAIWDDPKSWAHLATLPFRILEGFGRRPKDILDAYDLIPILWHTAVQVGHVPHLPQPRVCAFSAILSNFPYFLPAVHHVQPPMHAGHMDQWTIYDMGVMDIGPHRSHTTWAKRSNLR